MAAVATETLRIVDGTTMEVMRVPDVEDATWAELKAYIEGSSETAQALRQFAGNAGALRGWLQTQTIAEYYRVKLASGDRLVQERMEAVEEDPELAPVLGDVKKNGFEAAMKHFHDEELMLKFNRRMGGMPEELKASLKRLEETPLSLHEAAKKGDLCAAQEFLNREKPVDAWDLRGVTPLGYAVGANHVAVVKLLIDRRASPHRVDRSGNSGVHYAAGYGRTELVRYLLETGCAAGLANTKGQTPLALAVMNKHRATVQLLKAHGAVN